MLGNFIPLIKNFASSCSSSSFFGLPAWDKYIKVTTGSDGHCDFSAFKFWPPDNLLLILLAILDDLLIIGGIVAVVFVIIGGIQYVTSQGQPENTKHARGTIVNAVIGLVITIIAASLVNWLGFKLGSNV